MRWRPNAALASAIAFIQISTPTFAQPAAAPKLQWVLDQSGYYCALAAKLGGSPGSTFILRTLPGSGQFDVSLVGDGRWPTRVLSAHTKISVALSPGGEMEGDEPDTVIVDGGRTLLLKGVSGKFLNAFERSSGLTVVTDGQNAAHYELPPSANDAADALRECVTGKLVDAGANPAAFEAGARPAKALGNYWKWVDMPPVQSIGNDNLHLAIRVDVGADGKPTGCGVLELSAPMDRQAICREVMERARLEPARSANGTAVNTVQVYVFNETVHTHLGYADQ